VNLGNGDKVSRSHNFVIVQAGKSIFSTLILNQRNGRLIMGEVNRRETDAQVLRLFFISTAVFIVIGAVVYGVF